MVPGTAVLYKFVDASSTGSVTWEADPNHSLSVGCASETVAASWQT